MAPALPPAPPTFLCGHTRLLCRSYRRWTGKALALPEDDARALYGLPRAVVSHDTAADPVFNYGNALALRLFELPWEDFTHLPSRRSAEPLERGARQALLERVARHGHIADYSGVRISAAGRRFLISDAVVWNLLDEQGIYRGQAAAFDQWTYL